MDEFAMAAGFFRAGHFRGFFDIGYKNMLPVIDSTHCCKNGLHDAKKKLMGDRAETYKPKTGQEPAHDRLGYKNCMHDNEYGK
jgi:hypothetical protein